MPYGTVLDESGLVYVYDGSYEGFYTAVFEAVYSRRPPAGIVAADNAQLSLGVRYVEVETDAEKARRVVKAAREKLGAAAMRRVYLAFLAADLGRETAIYAFLMLGFKFGRRALGMLADANVFRVAALARNVSHETDKMQGFMRFSAMEGGGSYCRFSPVNNILPLVLGHFAARFGQIPLVIHDTGRGLLGISVAGERHIISAEGFVPPERSASEKAFTAAWRVFYDTVAIKERENKKLMKQLMPARYFRHYWDI